MFHSELQQLIYEKGAKKAFKMGFLIFGLCSTFSAILRDISHYQERFQKCQQTGYSVVDDSSMFRGGNAKNSFYRLRTD